jgi:hypothetical protein
MTVNVWDDWIKPVLFDLPEFKDAEFSTNVRAVRLKSGQWIEKYDIRDALPDKLYPHADFVPPMPEWAESIWFADDCYYRMEGFWHLHHGYRSHMDNEGRPFRFQCYCAPGNPWITENTPRQHSAYPKPEWWDDMVINQDLQEVLYEETVALFKRGMDDSDE